MNIDLASATEILTAGQFLNQLVIAERLTS